MPTKVGENAVAEALIAPLAAYEKTFTPVPPFGAMKSNWAVGSMAQNQELAVVTGLPAGPTVDVENGTGVSVVAEFALVVSDTNRSLRARSNLPLTSNAVAALSIFDAICASSTGC